ncbi:C-C motif chemokine 3-like isoform X2 [Mastacembelus armatus]|nr:C-C motif chemokine 3-like isoform X2 [Mastacembelus armatus]
MKTLCFTLVLLLLSACCCDAQPAAVQIATSPGSCCFRFFDQLIPQKFVARITQTHHSCVKKAFIVQTIRGRQICYSQAFQWAQNVYDSFHSAAGSGQQN